MKRVLVTGVAGFIGFHLANALKTRGDFCIGLDNFNNYYDPKLKTLRASMLKKAGVEVVHADICEKEKIKELIFKNQITHVVHLAAQAGVRYSMEHPNDYVDSNLQGFVSILESIRENPAIKLVYASSSSVYGLNKKSPFSVEDKTDQPTNLYGATKKANELIAHAYHHVFGNPCIALRYFTAYGPWGRPDMACYKFTQNIWEGKPIQVFNHGKMERDFTYIDDIVQGTLAAIDLDAKYEVFNLGNHRPIALLYLIELLEKELGKTAVKEMLPMQPGEVLQTCADIEKSRKVLNYCPTTSIEEGVSKFIQWFKQYHASLQKTGRHLVDM